MPGVTGGFERLMLHDLAEGRPKPHHTCQHHRCNRNADQFGYSLLLPP